MRTLPFTIITLYLWSSITNGVTASDTNPLAARQLVTLISYSTQIITTTSTALDEQGKPKSKSVWDGIITKAGAPLSQSWYMIADVTTITLAVSTRANEIVTVEPTFYTALPTTLPKGTNTIRLASTTTIYSVAESTVMNGPLISQTIYSTETVTVPRGSSFTTRTNTLSRPAVVTNSVAVGTSTITYTTTVIGTVELPATATQSSSQGSSTLTTLATRTSSSQASPTSSPSSAPSITDTPVGTSGSSKKIAAIAASVSIIAVLVLACLGFWYWRRRKVAKEAKEAASHPPIEKVGRPQSAFGPTPDVTARRETVISTQTSSDLPCGPYYNETSDIQRKLRSYRPSYQSFGSNLTPPRPIRPETLNSSLLGYMDGKSDSTSADFRIFRAEALRKDQEDALRELELEKRRLKVQQDLAEEEAAREAEIDRRQRLMSQENLALREHAEREEQRRIEDEMQRAAREFQEFLVPPPLHIIKRRQGSKPEEDLESYYGSMAPDGLNEVLDRRPYRESRYEDIPVDNSSSSDEAPSRNASSKRKAPNAHDRDDVLATTANLSVDPRRFEFVDDPDESDEEKKERERRVAERQLLYGDTRESIYSEGNESLGWRAYNQGMNLNTSPRLDQGGPSERRLR